MRKGKSLEKLIEVIERTFANKAFVQIDSPFRLRDRDTGKLLEHDVVLTITQGYHKLLIAIECRDRSRPVGVGQVNAFWKKCQDTGIGQGIIVSSRGFWKTAREKAEKLGIRCLDIEGAKSLNWILAPGLEIIHQNIFHIHWTIFPFENLGDQISEFNIEDEAGNVATTEALKQNVTRFLSKHALPSLPSYSGDYGQISIRFPGKGLLLRNKATGKCYPLNYLIAEVKYKIEQKLQPFRKLKYSERFGNLKIAEAAVADIDIGGIKKRAMLVYNYDVGGAVWLLPPGDDSKTKSES
jgi:hypothetical protein